jgi:N-acetylglucosamine-6-sulfatase
LGGALLLLVAHGDRLLRGDEQRPNMIVIVVDDLRWDELSCSGHPVVRTPHIDRLAQEGARFRNAFATTPLCSPSRACLLTGQYTFQHGVLDNTNRSARSHELATFPRQLHDAGYETSFIGKWHMGNDDTPRPGFDFWASLAGQGTSRDPLLNVSGQREQRSGYTTDVLSTIAVDYVRRAHARPFCLFLAHKALHPELIQFDDGSVSDPSAAKFVAADRHQALYRDAPIPRRLNVTDSLDGKPALRRSIGNLPPLGPATGTPDDTVRDRWRMLAAVDEGLGQLLGALTEAGTLDNTVVVFTSDHGYWYGEHGLSVERRLAYEEGIRIPLLIRYPPRVRAGTLLDELALTLDLAPTLLSLAKTTIPQSIAGRDLSPLWTRNGAVSWRQSFLIEYYSDTVFPRIDRMGYQAIRTEQYKYIHYAQLNGMDELYDLWADPYELRNVLTDPQCEEVLRQLRQELMRLSQRASPDGDR